MTILRVRGTCYWDVFLGEGWDHWSRIKIVNEAGTVVGGTVLHSGLIKEIIAHV